MIKDCIIIVPFSAPTYFLSIQKLRLVERFLTRRGINLQICTVVSQRVNIFSVDLSLVNDVKFSEHERVLLKVLKKVEALVFPHLYL